MYIVQGKEEIKIWIGSLIPQYNIPIYKEVAESFIKTLQKYERAV